MISERRWRLLICLITGLQLVKTQYPMFPMPGPPQVFRMPAPPPPPPPPPPPIPMFPVPAPMPVAMPMPVGGVAIPIRTFRLPKTCPTTEATYIELPPVPIPMPMPVQVVLPAQPPPPACVVSGGIRPPGCPPCPPCQCNPSCTPAFFSYCSPCHMKCRCRNQGDSYVVRPYRPFERSGRMPSNPMNMPPPPMVVVPFPEHPPMDRNDVRPYRRATSDESSSSYSSSSEYRYPTKRSRTRNTQYKRNRKRKYRRHFEVSDNGINKNDFIKPVLSYISQNGDIKLEKSISNDEAAQLLGDESFQTVKILAGEDSDNRPRILVRSNDKEKALPNARRRQVVLRRGASRHVLGEGKKELVFRPPQDKKISNLTVSFQIT